MVATTPATPGGGVGPTLWSKIVSLTLKPRSIALLMFKEYEESDKDQLQEVHLYKQVDRKFQTLYIQSLVRGALHSM